MADENKAVEPPPGIVTQELAVTLWERERLEIMAEMYRLTEKKRDLESQIAAGKAMLKLPPPAPKPVQG